MKKNRFYRLIVLVVVSVCLIISIGINYSCKTQEQGYYIDVRTTQRMHKLFQYKGDSVFFLSSHRGGPESNFSENCIETFENTLEHTYSMIECDPRYTKDSIIILHHDRTLDRTTTGHGKVSDFTFDELKALNLKDMCGNETSYKIPTLDYALEWAKRKTILVLDKKDVPIEMRVQKITEHKAETCSIVMAYSFDEAKRCYQLNKNIIIQIFINSPEKIQEFEKFGVPWKNVVVFVGHSEPVDPALYDMIHQKGALCILGTSRNIDKKFTEGKVSKMEELREDYNTLFRKGVDIIETDIPVSVSFILPEMPRNKLIKKEN